MNTATTSKLAELRSKTDRQLVAYLAVRLDAALQFTEKSEAECVYEESRALLTLIYGMTGAERRRLERKLSQLRELIEDLSSNAELRMQTACS